MSKTRRCRPRKPPTKSAAFDRTDRVGSSRPRVPAACSEVSAGAEERPRKRSPDGQRSDPLRRSLSASRRAAQPRPTSDDHPVGRGLHESRPPSPKSRIARYPLTRRHGRGCWQPLRFPGRVPDRATTWRAPPCCGLDVWRHCVPVRKYRRQCLATLQTTRYAWVTERMAPNMVRRCTARPKEPLKRLCSSGGRINFGRAGKWKNAGMRPRIWWGAQGARRLVVAWTSRSPTLSVTRRRAWRRR